MALHVSKKIEFENSWNIFEFEKRKIKLQEKIIYTFGLFSLVE